MRISRYLQGHPCYGYVYRISAEDDMMMVMVIVVMVVTVIMVMVMMAIEGVAGRVCPILSILLKVACHLPQVKGATICSTGV